jgi:penicillin-binding protein 1A
VLSLPIWINFMESALKGVPPAELTPPEGVVNVGGEWYYEEYSRGTGVRSLGMEDPLPSTDTNQPAPGQPEAEKKNILDLFRN